MNIATFIQHISYALGLSARVKDILKKEKKVFRQKKSAALSNSTHCYGDVAANKLKKNNVNIFWELETSTK